LKIKQSTNRNMGIISKTVLKLISRRYARITCHTRDFCMCADSQLRVAFSFRSLWSPFAKASISFLSGSGLLYLLSIQSTLNSLGVQWSALRRKTFLLPSSVSPRMKVWFFLDNGLWRRKTSPSPRKKYVAWCIWLQSTCPYSSHRVVRSIFHDCVVGYFFALSSLGRGNLSLFVLPLETSWIIRWRIG
jgi:hypothetical protein